MKIAVWDTYVSKKDGKLMHFDILVEETTPFLEVRKFGKRYLASKKQDNQPLTTEECKFCHIEKATTALESAIKTNGYSIIEMEGC